MFKVDARIKGNIMAPLLQRLIWLAVYADRRENERFIKFLEKIIPMSEYKMVLRTIRIFLSQEINPNCLKKMLEIILKSGFSFPSFLSEYQGLWNPMGLRDEKKFKRFDQIELNPTARCNLKCMGCFRGKDPKEETMDYSLLSRIVKEGKEMGTYEFVISGGEPFLRRDLLQLYEEHNDVYFLVFTNGILIDKKIAQTLGELGNVAIGISLEGFGAQTDIRRGSGVFNKAMKAMDCLKKEGIFFGFGVTVMKNNLKEVTSDRFIDFMIKKGCRIGAYFFYFPVGRDPQPSLRPDFKEINYFNERFRHIKANKAILVEKLSEDAFFPAPCIFPAKRYISITANGDVEPCQYVHFAVDNVKEKSLREISNSTYFKTMRENWTFKEFTMNPCLVTAKKEILEKFIEKTGAYPTHPDADMVVPGLKEYLVQSDEQMSEKVINKFSAYFRETNLGRRMESVLGSNVNFEHRLP